MHAVGFLPLVLPPHAGEGEGEGIMVNGKAALPLAPSHKQEGESLHNARETP